MPDPPGVGGRAYTRRLWPAAGGGASVLGPRLGEGRPAHVGRSTGTPALVSDAWYLSLDLRHRHQLLARGDIVAPPSVDPRVDSLLRRWRRQPPFDDERWFVERLARDGFDIQEFPRLLTSGGRAAEDVPERVSWRRLEQIYTGPRSGVAVTDPLGSVEPLLQDEVRAALSRHTPRLAPEPEETPDPADLAELLVAGCRRPLADLLESATDGWLAPGVGLAPEAVFGLFRQMPVLGRQLQERARLWIRHGLEVLCRLEEDWPLLVDGLLGGREPRAVVELDPTLGTRRRGGRAETRVVFEDGRSVIYRPHCLSPDQRLAELVRWLEARSWEAQLGALFDLRLPRLLPRDGYGWMEPVAGRPMSSLRKANGSSSAREGEENLARRLGIWVAIWRFLGGREAIQGGDSEAETFGGDFRQGDFVLAGDHPVPVDSGGFLAPRWRGSENPGGSEVDMCTADPTRPLLPGVALSQSRPFRKGYWLALAFFGRWSDELLDVDGPLEAFRQAEVRFQPRSAEVYRSLSRRSFRPEYLRDAAEREMCFDRLWQAIPEAEHLGRVVAVEKDHLRRGDSPELVGRPGSPHLRDPSGVLLHEVFESTALEDLSARLRRIRGKPSKREP